MVQCVTVTGCCVTGSNESHFQGNQQQSDACRVSWWCSVWQWLGVVWQGAMKATFKAINNSPTPVEWVDGAVCDSDWVLCDREQWKPLSRQSTTVRRLCLHQSACLGWHSVVARTSWRLILKSNLFTAVVSCTGYNTAVCWLTDRLFQ